MVAGTVCDPFPTACDIRVVKHDANTGTVIWSVTFDAAGFDEVLGLAIGADGHPVISGGSCANAYSGCDFRIFKLNGMTGAVLWSVTFDGGGGDEATVVAIGPDGNPVITGFSCPADFGPACDPQTVRARTIKLNGATGTVL